eukprot:TRINITY_DN410_c0_g1_i1.p1 TRINITY_DN410_c0_g1~~TRINITY_DN410_c0_g1_i1.p1  ORF type:complete len:162 (+),score=76.53 TRINITY_DN410_c0_g1_i1:65-487(+)
MSTMISEGKDEYDIKKQREIVGIFSFTGQRKMERKLGIKSDSIKRLIKEVGYYQKELETQRAKMSTMISEGKDEYDIKKQREIVEESETMVPDTINRLLNSVRDLELFMEENADLESSPKWAAAISVLADARALNKPSEA